MTVGIRPGADFAFTGLAPGEWALRAVVHVDPIEVRLFEGQVVATAGDGEVRIRISAK